MLLINGVVYFGFSSHGDVEPFHGWVLGYNASTLQQVMVYNTTPNGADGGVWMDGDGVATDSTGSLYFISGDGTMDANTGGTDYGDSFIRLSTSGAVQDYFSPSVQTTLDPGQPRSRLRRRAAAPRPARGASARDGQRRQERHRLPRRPRQHGRLPLEQRPDHPGAQRHLPEQPRHRGRQLQLPRLLERLGLLRSRRGYRPGLQADERPALDEPDLKELADLQRPRRHDVDLGERRRATGSSGRSRPAEPARRESSTPTTRRTCRTSCTTATRPALATSSTNGTSSPPRSSPTAGSTWRRTTRSRSSASGKSVGRGIRVGQSRARRLPR